MRQSTNPAFLPVLAALLLSATACTGQPKEAEVKPPEAAAQRNAEEGQALVLLRGLPTLGTKHSVAIVELDPEAPNFGAILQDVDLPDLTRPLHHLYYSPTGRLYSTGLDPKCSLAEVDLSRNAQGAATPGGNRSARTSSGTP